MAFNISPNSSACLPEIISPICLAHSRCNGADKREFILALPGERYGYFLDLLEPFHKERWLLAKKEILGETSLTKHRLIITHDPQVTLDSLTSPAVQ